ncbi:hypothetical protein [Rubrivirga marina]|uniref:Uncharacterized protein n=1 Tax=Rubrivirga marina TaxID=1196024 RepID=A0A271J176_9BACT|nr:hypothetical protein [Rubrivirga marina]PAP76705.1 hypothetical protein BSZ37_09765 [Rubrivirga marina]
MRALLLALLAISATAQPVASLRLGAPLPEADVSPGLRATAGTLFGTTGAFVGGGSAALGVVMVGFVAGDCSPFGCAGTVPDLTVPLVVAFASGGALGSAVAVHLIATDAGRRYGTRAADVGFRRDDWARALAGALVGTVPELLAVALIGPSEGGGEWIAVPIAQGLGTGLALAL